MPVPVPGSDGDVAGVQVPEVAVVRGTATKSIDTTAGDCAAASPSSGSDGSGVSSGGGTYVSPAPQPPPVGVMGAEQPDGPPQKVSFSSSEPV